MFKQDVQYLGSEKINDNITVDSISRARDCHVEFAGEHLRALLEPSKIDFRERDIWSICNKRIE